VREALWELSAHENKEIESNHLDGQYIIAFSLNDSEMDRDLDAGSHDSSLETDEIDERSEQSIQLFDVHDQDDYMDSFPEQPNRGPTTGQIIFQPVMEKNQFAAHNFIIANQEDSESDEGYTLPLCFEAFDIMKRGFKVMNGEFLEVLHEYPFCHHEKETHDMGSCHTTQENTHQVTVSPLVVITSEQDLDDEFHNDFPEFEAHMHHLCQEPGPQEKDKDGQSIISLSSPFPDSLSREVILGSDLFHHEDSVAACHDQMPNLPAIVLSPPFVNELVCHDLPIYDDYEDVFLEQLVVPAVLLSPSAINNQMVTDLPIYDEYPSQSGDEIEKCIFPNTSNCETTCQYPMPLEDTSSNSLDSHDHMSSKLMREVEMK
jgi:hypothetical protein